MRGDIRFSRILSALAASFLVAACGDDRSAGGTIGTEAGNAIAARILTTDGKPAVHALVTARPAEAIDTTGKPDWILGTADSNGVVDLRLPDGAWTLEYHLGAVAARLDIQVGSDLVLSDTLLPLTVADGVILGAKSGERVFLPGLARSSVVAADGSFHFDSIPSGTTRIRSEDGTTWRVTDSVLPAVVLFPDTSVRPLPGHSFATPALTSPVRYRVSDSLLPASGTTLVDAQGSPIPMLIGPSRNGFRQIWTGPSTQPAAALVQKRTTTSSPFSSAQGLRYAWLPEFADSNLVGNVKFVFDTSVKMDSLSSEGRFRKDVIGFPMGYFPDSPVPDTGAFSLSARIRLHAPSTASVPVWNWIDPTSTTNGFALKVGGDRMDLHLGNRDTTLSVPTPTSWSTWCIAWNGQYLTVWVDGTQVFHAVASGLATRSTWTRRQFAPKGGLDVDELFAWDRAIDGQLVSAPVETRK